MIDFHSHILPMMDDGAQSLRDSLEMLALSKQDGVNTVIATPHFYADEDDPASFLSRRSDSYALLRKGLSRYSPVSFPNVILGAEVLYFDGMSDCRELERLTVEGSPLLLVEPPMQRWTDFMIDEIEDTGRKLRLIPVVAHIDRYMRIMHDFTLIDRISGRRMLSQINASFLIRSETVDLACDLISEGRVHFIGSDCHDPDNRPPNLGRAFTAAVEHGIEDDYIGLHSNVRKVLGISQ